MIRGPGASLTDSPRHSLPHALPFFIGLVAYDFQIHGWEDQDGNRHSGRSTPPLSQTYGVYLKVTNRNDPADVAWWWAFVYTPFETWDEWYVYIAALAAQHGYDLA